MPTYSPALRLLVTGSLAILVSLAVGFLIGDADYVVIGGVLALVIFTAVIAVVSRKILPEAFCVVCLVSGYILGGKGFAYIHMGSAPLFIGEVVLAICVCFVLSRRVISGDAFPRSSLSVPLLLFGIYCALHLVVDVRKNGLMAMRDAAMAYYIIFFFIGLSVSRDEASFGFAKKWIPRALVVLCFVIEPFFDFTGWWQKVTVRGMPIIAHNSDTSAGGFLLCGVYFYLQARRPRGISRIFLYALSLLCIVMTMYFARSTYTVATVTVGIFLFFAGESIFARNAIALVAAAVLGFALIYSSGSMRLFHNAQVENATQHLASLANPVSANPDTIAAQTIDWRLTWWRTATSRTWDEAPLFGQGFGADISTQFFQTFYGNMNVTDEHVAARSPHNVLITVFARTGLIGTILFVTMIASVVREISRAATATRRKLLDTRELLLWCLVVVYLVASFFSVVLEGPFGAITFWTVLGLSSGHLHRVLDARRSASAQTARAEPVSLRRPVFAQQPAFGRTARPTFTPHR